MKASEYLEHVSKKLNLYINPVTQQNLKSFTDGFTLGYVLADGRLDYHDVVNAWQQVVAARRWEVNALGPHKEMEERGMSEKEIINELLQIEIQVWKLLEEHAEL